MHAPTAGIFGLPAPTRRSENPLRTGLNRIPVRVGRSNAFRSRAFPDFDSRVRPLTLDPLLNSRGDSPQYAAADWADGTRSRAGNSASTVDAVGAPTPGIEASSPASAARAGAAAVTASASYLQQLDDPGHGLAGGRGQQGRDEPRRLVGGERPQVVPAADQGLEFPPLRGRRGPGCLVAGARGDLPGE